MASEPTSRTKAFLNNSAWSLVLQLVNIVVGLIVPRFIISVYGSDVNGLVSSLTQFVSYISLVEAGISSAAVFALYGPLASRDLDKISLVVSAAKRFYYKSGGIFTVLILALAAVYPIIINVSSLDAVEVCILTVSLGATGFLDFFTLAKYRVLLTASQRNWVIQIATIIYKVLYTAAVAICASLGMSVVTVYLVAIIPILVRTLILIAYTRRCFPNVDFSTPSRGYKLQQRWDALFLQVLGAVQTGAPTIIATFILKDLSMVSVFSVYLLVANGIQNMCSAFSNGTQASFGDVIVRGEEEVLKKSFKEFQIGAYGISAIFCGTAFTLILPFVTLYTNDISDVNYIYPLIGYLSIINVLMYHMKTPQGLLVISAGLYHETRYQTLIQTVILIVAGVAFGMAWGVPGILFGSILSNLYRDLDLAYFIPKRVTHTAPKETLLFMAVSCLACAVTTLPFQLIGVSCENWAEWVVWGVASLAWGAVVVLGLYHIAAPKETLGLLRRVTRVVRRKTFQK